MQVELSRSELILIATAVADSLNHFPGETDVENLEKKIGKILEHDKGQS